MSLVLGTIPFLPLLQSFWVGIHQEDHYLGPYSGTVPKHIYMTDPTLLIPLQAPTSSTRIKVNLVPFQLSKMCQPVGEHACTWECMRAHTTEMDDEFGFLLPMICYSQYN